MRKINLIILTLLLVFNVSLVFATQHDMNVSKDDANTGVSVRAGFNEAIQALASTNAGDTEPSTIYPSQVWMDTASDLLKIRSEDNMAWVVIGYVNPVNDTITFIPAGTISPFQYSTFSAAVASCTDHTLAVDSAVTLDANTTIPIGCSLVISESGSIAKASTYTLTINGDFQAGNYTVLTGFSAGDVTFGEGSILFSLSEWFGAKGDSDGTADNGTDDTTAIQSAVDSFHTVRLLDKFYRISSYIDVSATDMTIYGAGASFRLYKTALIPDAALANYSIIVESLGGVTLRDFAIVGNDTSVGLGGLYLKDPTSTVTSSNTVKNFYVTEFVKDEAVGINVQSFATTLDHVFVSQIDRGWGVLVGKSGTAVTTFKMVRPYINGCDVGIHIRYTNLGVTIEEPILETNTVDIVNSSSSSVVIINPYLENVNVFNDDGVVRESLAYPTCNTQSVDASIFNCNGSMTIEGGHLQSVGTADDSKILFTGSGAYTKITGFDFSNKVTAAGQIDVPDDGTIILEDSQNLDTDFLPTGRSEAIQNHWSNNISQTVVLGSDAVDAAFGATETVLDDYGTDNFTLYTFKVIGVYSNQIRSVHELYLDNFNGGGCHLFTHINYDQGSVYPATFAIANCAGGTTDIEVTNGHGANTVTYKLMLMDAVRTQ